MALIDLFIAILFLGLGVWLDRKFGDKILAWYQGAAKFAANLEAKAAAIKAAVK